MENEGHVAAGGEKMKKAKQKRKRKAAPSPDGDDSSALDDRWEEFRQRCSLSAMNVKSILKHVLGDERVVSMALKAAAAVPSSATAGNSPVYDDTDDSPPQLQTPVPSPSVTGAAAQSPLPSVGVAQSACAAASLSSLDTPAATPATTGASTALSTPTPSAAVASVPATSGAPLSSKFADELPLEPKLTRSKAKGQPFHLLTNACQINGRFQTYIPIQAPPSVLTAEFSDDSDEEYKPAPPSSSSPRKRHGSPRKKTAAQPPSALVTSVAGASDGQSLGLPDRRLSDNEGNDGLQSVRSPVSPSTVFSDSGSSSSSSSGSDTDSDSSSVTSSSESEPDWDDVVLQFGGTSASRPPPSPRTRGEVSPSTDVTQTPGGDRVQPVSTPLRSSSTTPAIVVSSASSSETLTNRGSQHSSTAQATAMLAAGAALGQDVIVLDEGQGTPRSDSAEPMLPADESSLSAVDLFRSGSIMDPWSPSMVDVSDSVARRTRSRLPLTNVEIEQLEAAQLPDEVHSSPPTEPANYSKGLDESFDPEDDAFTSWLSALMKDDVLPDEEEEDTEYNYIADEQHQKFEEEFRKDKAVKVSAKEYNSLIGDLVESVDPLTGQLCPTAATKPIIEDSEVQKHMVAMLAQEENQRQVMNELITMEMDDKARTTIREQIEMHAQLLLQTFVLGRCDERLQDVVQSSADMLNELQATKNEALTNPADPSAAQSDVQPTPQSGTSDDGSDAPANASAAVATATAKSAAPSSRPTTRPLLVLDTPVIDVAMTIVMTPPVADEVMTSGWRPPKRRSRTQKTTQLTSPSYPSQPSAPSDIVAKVFLDHPTIFLRRPYLLPITRFVSLSYLDELALRSRRVAFSTAEDNLLALGLTVFGKNYDLITANYLPMKTPQQLKIRHSNRTKSKKELNVIRTLKKTGSLRLDPPFSTQELLAPPPPWILRARLRFMQMEEQLEDDEEPDKSPAPPVKSKSKVKAKTKSSSSTPQPRLLPNAILAAAQRAHESVLQALPTAALYNASMSSSDNTEITIFGSSARAQQDVNAVASIGLLAKSNTNVVGKQIVPLPPTASLAMPPAELAELYHQHQPVSAGPSQAGSHHHSLAWPASAPAARSPSLNTAASSRGAVTSATSTGATASAGGVRVGAGVATPAAMAAVTAAGSNVKLLPVGGMALTPRYKCRPRPDRREKKPKEPTRWKRPYRSKKHKEDAAAEAAIAMGTPSDQMVATAAAVARMAAGGSDATEHLASVAAILTLMQGHHQPQQQQPQQ
eukprot:scpid24867/ scgid1953/ GON-4-like protein; GON-4 homolog